VAAAVGILVLVPTIRTLITTHLSSPQGERLRSVARLAVASAPGEAATWHTWSRRLPALLPDLAATVIMATPGHEDFARICSEAGVDPGRALDAYSEGELLSRVPLALHDEPTDDSIPSLARRPWRWEALARMQARDGRQGLLVLVERSGTPSPSASAWGLILLYGSLVMLLALMGGMLAGYFLIVRPVAKATHLAQRLGGTPGDAPAGDIPALAYSLEAARHKLRDLSRESERQGYELRRIRTDLKGAQASLLRAEKLASVGRLAAGIAHEIGNPIGVILGMSEILKEGASPQEQQLFATEIHAATLRVHQTLKDLLAFARPVREEGAMTDVRAVIESTLKLLFPHRLFQGVRAVTRFEDDAIMADIRPSLLQQVLVNLLLNAADAMGGKGQVFLDARIDDRFVVVEVCDEGPGIPEQDQPHIFDPFFSTKPPGEGTGLGLAICAQILEVYGGEITVESPPGRGACFTVRLWRAMPEP
jgi:signal transduction histidine kinase